MTDKLLPADLRKIVDGLVADVRTLKMRAKLGFDFSTRVEVVFGQGTGAVVAGLGPDTVLEEGGTAKNAVLLAKGAGTGTTTYQVLRDGSVIGTLSLGATATVAKANLDGSQFGPDSTRLSYNVTAAGGHTGLVLQVRFR